MSADSGAPPVRSGDATRRALLAAAADLFAEHGYDRTPVRAIAEESGVRMPSFFGYVIFYSLPILLPVMGLTAVIFLW